MWGLAAGAGNMRYAASALQTEAMAALQVIQHATHLGMMRIILETDATALALALSSTEKGRSTIGSLIHQIRDHMVYDFNSCKVSTCNRTCNRVADGLTSHGACVLAPDYSMFFSQAPEFVTNFVSGDLPGHAC
jgi:hypothetical protein